MQIWQGVPTAVGSGQQSLRRKVQAVAHSLRLSSPSWAATAQLMRNFCTFTGDLGVESGFWMFCQSLTKLFWEWILQAYRHRSTAAPKGDDNDTAPPSST